MKYLVNDRFREDIHDSARCTKRLTTLWRCMDTPFITDSLLRMSPVQGQLCPMRSLCSYTSTPWILGLSAVSWDARYQLTSDMHKSRRRIGAVLTLRAPDL